jgi:hypothetical protein
MYTSMGRRRRPWYAEPLPVGRGIVVDHEPSAAVRVAALLGLDRDVEAAPFHMALAVVAGFGLGRRRLGGLLGAEGDVGRLLELHRRFAGSCGRRDANFGPAVIVAAAFEPRRQRRLIERVR